MQSPLSIWDFCLGFIVVRGAFAFGLGSTRCLVPSLTFFDTHLHPFDSLPCPKSDLFWHTFASVVYGFMLYSEANGVDTQVYASDMPPTLPRHMHGWKRQAPFQIVSYYAAANALSYLTRTPEEPREPSHSLASAARMDYTALSTSS